VPRPTTQLAEIEEKSVIPVSSLVGFGTLGDSLHSDGDYFALDRIKSNKIEPECRRIKTRANRGKVLFVLPIERFREQV
jgi:hypothetical protein